MNPTAELIQSLNTIQVQATEVDYQSRGYHIEIQMAAESIRALATFLLEKEFYLDFVTAVHADPAIQVVYQFGKFDTACRINAKAIVNEAGDVPSISDIYHGANWHERETHDFYGVQFIGHPDMRPLLIADDDVDLKPLLKSEKTLKSLDQLIRKDKELSDGKSDKQKA